MTDPQSEPLPLVVFHPNISIERVKNINNSENESVDEHSLKSENEHWEPLQVPMKHPNMNMARDDDFMSRLNPRCDFLTHPNMRIARLPKFSKCEKSPIEDCFKSKPTSSQICKPRGCMCRMKRECMNNKSNQEPCNQINGQSQSLQLQRSKSCCMERRRRESMRCNKNPNEAVSSQFNRTSSFCSMQTRNSFEKNESMSSTSPFESFSCDQSTPLKPAMCQGLNRPPSRNLQIVAPCDSYNVCNNCPKPPQMQVRQSCQSLNVCGSCQREKFGPTSCQNKSKQPESTSCDSMGVCDDCRKTRQSAQVSKCDSMSICNMCGKSSSTANKNPSQNNLKLCSSLPSTKLKSASKISVNCSQTEKPIERKSLYACKKPEVPKKDILSDWPQKCVEKSFPSRAPKLTEESKLGLGITATKSKVSLAPACDVLVKVAKPSKIEFKSPDLDDAIMVNKSAPNQLTVSLENDATKEKKQNELNSTVESRLEKEPEPPTGNVIIRTGPAGELPANPGDSEKTPNDVKKCPKSGRKLLYLRPKNDDDDLKCPENPCEKSESEKNRMAQLNRNRPAKAKSCLDPIDETTENEGSDDGEDSVDEGCAKLQESSKAISNGFCKKYLKMRYEIEMQNYLISKQNRELQAKTKKCCPQDELCQLKFNLDKEVLKLRKMVEFAISMQRKNAEEKWGPIAISTFSKNQIRKSLPCPPEPVQKLKAPETPSGVTLVSGFDELDDVLMACEEETCLGKNRECPQQCLNEDPRVKFGDQTCSNEVRCEDLFGTRSDKESSNFSKRVVELELKTVTDSMKALMSNVDTMKCKIQKLRKEFGSYKKTK